MDYFSKNKIIGWIIIAGLAINLAAISTILYKVYYQKKEIEREHPMHKNQHGFIRKELNLSNEQDIKFKEIKEISKKEAKAIFIKMREQRKDLLAVLTEKNPDTLKINQIITEIEKSHSMLLQHTVNHYFQLKNILREDQYQKLNLLFMDMFGCEKGPGDSRNGDSCVGGKGDEPGNKHHKHNNENSCNNEF